MNKYILKHKVGDENHIIVKKTNNENLIKVKLQILFIKIKILLSNLIF